MEICRNQHGYAVMQSLGFCRMFPASPGRLSWILLVYPDASPAPACLSRLNRPNEGTTAPKKDALQPAKRMLGTTGTTVCCPGLVHLHALQVLRHLR